jgi:uncharacterized integral membrane protein
MSSEKANPGPGDAEDQLAGEDQLAAGAPPALGDGSQASSPGTEASAAAPPEGKKGAPATRTSAAWTALAIGLALLVVMVVFVLENLQDVKVTFFGIHWRIPLALDLLLAAALGGAVVFTAGALRMLQLRLHARRHRAGLKRSAHRGTVH